MRVSRDADGERHRLLRFTTKDESDDTRDYSLLYIDDRSQFSLEM